MVNFADIKNNRSSAMSKLNDQLAKMGKGFYEDDSEKYWKPIVDKAGNGFAVLRFLPPPQGEDMPYVRRWDHGFQGPGGLYYIENSLTTLGLPDPVSEFNSELWNSTKDDNAPPRQQARKQKRRENYYSNVYIVKDPANPSNEGKVFLYKYGKKIFEKLKDMMSPQYGEAAVNPFDLWEGANFQLKIRKYEGYQNYDKSDFASPAPLLTDDDELEAVWKQEHSLKEIVDPKNFKSYEELKTKLYKVLGLDGSTHAPTGNAAEDDEEMDYTPKFKERQAPKLAETPSPDIDDDDPDMSFFKALAED
jgi:hypothetical protein